jgi:acetylglutamate kinase
VVVEPKLEPAGLEFVGHPVAVNRQRLTALVDAGFVPCLAPICLSRATTQLYNVNADPVAAAVAEGTGAKALLFITNVGAVLRDGQPLAELTLLEVENLISQGVIADGMIPKVRAACAAVETGVARVVITDLAGLQSWLTGGVAGPVSWRTKL